MSIQKSATCRRRGPGLTSCWQAILPDSHPSSNGFWHCASSRRCASGSIRRTTPPFSIRLEPFAGLNAVSAPEVSVGAVARYLGILASTMSRWEDAARHFEDALEMNKRMGARPWLAHTQNDYARMLLARDRPGDRERAQELLEQALATYRELGMEPNAVKASSVTSMP